MGSVFGDLKGQTISKVDVGDDEIRFHLDNGAVMLMHHQQDCCEGVSVEDVYGDLDSICETPIILAEERSMDGPAEHESSTWTFYTIRTIKGTVDIRWLGVSNGYYSESVDVVWEKEGSALSPSRIDKCLEALRERQDDIDCAEAIKSAIQLIEDMRDPALPQAEEG